MRAEIAHVRLSETRDRYWQHVKVHHCDPAAVLAAPPVHMDAVAV
jgi:hypothetical protein